MINNNIIPLTPKSVMLSPCSQIVIFMVLSITLPVLHAGSVSIPQTSCSFAINQTNSTFLFQNCSFSSSGSNDWVLCFTNCCPVLSIDDYPAPSFNALVICQSKQTVSSTFSLLLIGLIVTAVVASLILLTCVFIVCVRIIKTAYQNRVFNHDQDQSIQWNCPEQLTQDPLNMKWQVSDENENHIRQSQCSICLEDGPNTSLFCGHSYHPACIIKWLQKADFCPLCHRQNIRALKLYCPTCQRYLLVRKKLLKTPQLFLKNDNCPPCSLKISKMGARDNSLIFQMSLLDISDGFIA